MSTSGSSPIDALGVRSGRTLRCDERVEPAGEPSAGTVDSVEAAGSSITGSDDRERDDPPTAAPAAGWVTIALEPAPEPQLVQGAAAACGMV